MDRLSSSDRLLIVAAHPDDETLGAGGFIQSALDAGAQVRVLYLTRGDFILSGRMRRREAEEAAWVLGLSRNDLVFLGYPDSGLLAIWRKHWGKAKPFRTFFGRVQRVPYPDDLSYGKEHKGENVLSDLEHVLRLFQPTRVLAPSPQDLNPDHQAAHLFLNAALGRVAEYGACPRVLLYLVHARDWPRPRGHRPDHFLEPPRAFNGGGSGWLRFGLGAREVRKKEEALSKYRSQMVYNRGFLLSFVRANELFFAAGVPPAAALKRIKSF